MLACWNRVCHVLILLVFASIAHAQQVDKLALLRNLEAKILGPPLIDGPRQHDELIDYYLAANPRLKNHLQQAKQRLLSGEATKLRPFRHLTLIAGVAGVGKSTALRTFLKDPDLESVLYKCDLKTDFYQPWEQADKAELRPDLRSNGLVLNEMLALKKGESGDLINQLQGQSANTIYIDSLDEIHPDEYLKTLRMLEAFVKQSKQPYLHVMVLGRPEAFWDYWVREGAKLTAEQVDMFILRAPEYKTTGDLAVLHQSYDEWRYHVCWKSGKTLSPEEYLAFQEGGYKHRGKFANITFKPNANMLPQTRNRFEIWAKTYPEVRYSLGTLAGSGFWHEIAESVIAQKTQPTLRELEEQYFSLCLVRDTRPINRPSTENPQFLELYRSLLEQVALDYDNVNQLDAQGYFRVMPEAEVTVDYQSESVSFSVVDLLDRSGLVSVDLNSTGERRYRFEPFWFHRFLAERAMKREQD